MSIAFNETKGIRCLIYLFWICLTVLTIYAKDSSASEKYLLVQPDNIKMFYTDANKIRIGKKTQALKKQLRVDQFNLGSVDKIESMLSKNLPSNLKQAERIAQRRADSFMKNQELLDAMRQGYEGIIVANAMGLKKTPAIVFTWEKQLFVVYGERNSDIGLKQFQMFIKKRKRK